MTKTINLMAVNAAMQSAPAGAFVSLDTVTFTKVAGIRGGGFVRKTTKGMQINSRTSYVKRAKAKDESFELSPRAWGVRMQGDIVEHKGAQYFEAVYDPESSAKKPNVSYEYGETQEGPFEPITFERFQELVPSKPRSKSGIEVRVFKAESITRIKAGGKEFIKAA